MNAEETSRYFQELTRNLQHEGFMVGPETEEGFLPVELDGQRLCHVVKSGGVRYRKENVDSDARRKAMERVTDIAWATVEYMRQMEAAPPLIASGLAGDFRLLADFNGVVLAGHPTPYGVQFVTWERDQERTGLNAGNYYGPSGGADSYDAAKQNFAVRSGLVPRSALFTPEQLTEVYRSVHETPETVYPLTEKRRNCLESIAAQIERGVPDLEARVDLSKQKEVERTDMESPQEGGMQLR